MINMLDRDYSGKMGFSEFKELWAALGQWKVSGLVGGHCGTRYFTLCQEVVEVKYNYKEKYPEECWEVVPFWGRRGSTV